jgi:pimeloyl-ACP methyl ester carboxylesterase
MPGQFRAPVPGGSITGWLAGDGPPVLVLHGGPGLSDYTAPLAAELEDASVLDAAGAGRAWVIGHSWAVTWPCT